LLLLETDVCFDLNRSVKRVHFGFCFAYDNCSRYLVVVYFCVIMKMLDIDFVSSADNVFFVEDRFCYTPQLRKVVSEYLVFLVL
jgi:hypothetical protein